jgi:hypothetical protein
MLRQAFRISFTDHYGSVIQGRYFVHKSVVGVLLLSLVFLTGCASIFNHGGYLSVDTTPPSAKVVIKGMDSGERLTLTTPCTFMPSRKSDYQVTISMAGYQSETIVIRRSISGWFWGNILIGGLIGMAIDWSTANMYEHSPMNLNIDLTKASTLPDTISGDFPVTLLLPDGTKLVKLLPITFHKLKT